MFKPKKLLSLLLSVFLLAGLLTPAHASNDPAGSRLSESELHELITNGMYDLADGNLVITYVEEMDQSINASRSIDSLGKTFKATTLTLVPSYGAIDDLETAGAELGSTTGSKTEETVDSSYSVRIYTTINYSYSTYGGNEYISIHSVSGGWTNSDRSVRIHSQALSINQKGGVYEGGFKIQTQSEFPTGASWAYNTPSSWAPVSVDGALTTVGVLYTAYLKRRTETESTWSVSLNNSLVVNISG